MDYRTINELAILFCEVNGKAANELWMHPCMMDMVRSRLYRELMNKPAPLIHHDQSMAIFIVTDVGEVTLKTNDRILPGVVYLDRDGIYTNRPYPGRYERMPRFTDDPRATTT